MNGKRLFIFFTLFIVLVSVFILTNFVLDTSQQVKTYGWYALGLGILFLGAIFIDILLSPSKITQSQQKIKHRTTTTRDLRPRRVIPRRRDELRPMTPQEIWRNRREGKYDPYPRPPPIIRS